MCTASIMLVTLTHIIISDVSGRERNWVVTYAQGNLHKLEPLLSMCTSELIDFWTILHLCVSQRRKKFTTYKIDLGTAIYDPWYRHTLCFGRSLMRWVNVHCRRQDWVHCDPHFMEELEVGLWWSHRVLFLLMHPWIFQILSSVLWPEKKSFTKKYCKIMKNRMFTK